jgi:hypothetical protein
LYKIPWSFSENYYIQGPSDIIYNSLGTLDNSSMFNTPYKLFVKKAFEKDGRTYHKDEEVANVEWVIQYFLPREKGSKQVSKNNLSNNKY